MFVKVWDVYPQKGKTIGARCSASTKDSNGEWTPSFAGIINFAGQAAVETILSVAPDAANGQKVTFTADNAPSINAEEFVISGGISKRDDNGKSTGEYTPYRITSFKATLRDNNSKNSGKKQQNASASVDRKFMTIPDSTIDEELPFS